MRKTKTDHRALIANEHINGGKSLRTIEREFGLANGCLSNFAKRHGVHVRDKSQQAIVGFASGAIERKTGDKHWAFGKTKDTASAYALHAVRMSINNPSRMPGVAERVRASNLERGHFARASERLKGASIPIDVRKKIAQSVAPQLLQRISEREKVMLAALAFDHRWIPQHQAGEAIIDFARVDILAALEPHCGGEKFDRAVERDTALVRHGWTILRFRADIGLNTGFYAHVLRIAEKVLPDFKCPDELPPARSGYRVVIRCPEHPAGLRVNDPNDPAIAGLRERIQHRLESAAMR